MNAVLLQLIVSIIPKVIEYGAPAVIGAIAALNKDEITQEDIDALAGMIKPPEEY